MSDATITGYITKHFDEGIWECIGVELPDGGFYGKSKSMGCFMNATNGQWARTLECALWQLEQEREDKIKSIESQVEILRSIKFIVR